MKAAFLLILILCLPFLYCQAQDKGQGQVEGQNEETIIPPQTTYLKVPIPPDTKIITTESGLKYSVLKKGRGGPSPKINDNVTCHYSGWLMDGTVYDSSVQRDNPSSFPVNRAIPGWREALLLMTPGEVFKLTVPPELAYGTKGAKPVIPPDAAVILVVELISFKADETLPRFHEGNPEKQVTLSSGLVYEVLKEGTGPKPKMGDRCEIDFAVWSDEGALMDGTAVERRKLVYQLKTGGLKILNEAVLLIPEGGRYRFLAPPDYAYGEKGRGWLVDSDEITTWEVEVVDIILPLPVPDFEPMPEEGVITMPSGLRYVELKKGEGDSPKMGDGAFAFYAGWLADGTLIDECFTRGEARPFKVGSEFPGWNEALQLMKTGGTYRFFFPSYMAYGERGVTDVVPPNTDIIFQAELMEVKQKQEKKGMRRVPVPTKSKNKE